MKPQLVQYLKRYIFSDPLYGWVRKLPIIKEVMHNPFRIKSLLDFLEQSKDPAENKKAASNICHILKTDLADWSDKEPKYHNKLLNTAEYLAQKTVLSSFPTRIYLELTNACNLECPMCGQSFFGGKRAFFDRNALDKIVPLYPYLEDLCLAGFGETLIYPHLEEVFNKIPSYVPTRIITNGLPLTEKLIELFAGKLNSIWVSFEATDARTYQEIRGVDAYKALLEKLKMLQDIKRCKKTALPHLYLCFVSMRQNISQLPDYIEQAASLGAAGVKTNFLTVFRESMKKESLYYEPERAQEFFEKAKDTARRHNIEFTYPDDEEKSEDSFFKCKEPWNFSYFSATGDIIPCCVYTLPMGNIYRNSFSDIWNNTHYQQFREKVNSGEKRPERCRRCIIDAHRSAWDKNRHFQLINERNQLIKDDEID